MTQLEQLKAKAREESSAIAFYQYAYIPMGVHSENYWKAIDTLIETVYQARTEEVRKLALRWYDENYKHGKHEDGSTTYITEKEFDDFLATLKDTKITNPKE